MGGFILLMMVLLNRRSVFVPRIPLEPLITDDILRHRKLLAENIMAHYAGRRKAA